MSDGILIDRYDTWFGARSVPFSKKVKKLLEKEKLSTSEKINLLKSSLLKNDFNEFKNLSQFWKKMEDKKQCEILEVFLDCQEIKKRLGRDKNKTINELLELSIEKLFEIFSNSREEFPKLTAFIGENKFIDLPLIPELKLLTGDPVDRWVREYINSENVKDSKSKTKEANPLIVLRNLFFGESSFFDCSEGSKENLKIYPECNVLPNKKNNFESKIVTEKELIPKVKGVLKVGMKEKQGDLRISVGNWRNLRGTGSAWGYELQLKQKESKAKEILSSWEKSGRYEGIIDADCNYLNIFQSLGWLGINISSPSASTCKEIWRLIFPGYPGFVHEKRWCLFELPEGSSYVREFKFHPFLYSQWFNTNKFWASCSSYGLNQPVEMSDP